MPKDKMFEKYKEHLWNWFGIFAWGFLLVHLIFIKLNGIVEIYESMPIILWAELIIVPIIVIFGIIRDIRDWRVTP